MFEACGNSAFLTGSFSAIAREFPTKVASMFSLIELFFGIGKAYDILWDRMTLLLYFFFKLAQY